MTQVTVLIPAHNAASTLAQTLDSLCAQHLQDFAVLLVDDASQDATAQIALGYRDRLAIEVMTQRRNTGVAGALNAGLAQIRSPYIARLDADDLAQPERLSRQLSWLTAHPETDVCGSALEIFYDQPGQPSQLAIKPADDSAIKTSLIQGNCLAHPSLMLRRSFFDDVGGYDVRYDYAEDYELWCRGALLGKRYANLPEALTRYRVHGGQVSQQKLALQRERDMLVRRRYLQGLLAGSGSAYLAEFFSPLVGFSTREIALAILQQSLPALFRLEQVVADRALFHQLVSHNLARHWATP